MFLIRWLLKIVNFIPGYIIFGPKKHFLGNVRTTAFFKGPAIISMNHTAFLDYIVALLLFPFRRMDVLVSEAMYNYNPVLRFCLKCFGVIKVSALTGNMAAVNEAVGKIKKGHLVLIFPEGRIETTPELMEYRQSAALIALSSGAPVIPIFHDGNIKPFKRDMVFIGSEMYAGDFTCPEDNLSQAAAKFTKAIFEKTKLFHDNFYRYFYSRFDKTPAKKEKASFPNLFVKYTAWPLIKILIRPRVICENEIAKMALYNRKKSMVICNHTWWLDNPVIHLVFFKRKVRSVAAKDIAEKNAAQRIMQSIMGSVFIDRFGYDWAGIKNCMDILNNEGCLSICPEGHFNFTDELLPFQKGAAMISVMTSAPVIPVYINCAYKAFKKSYIFVGEPVILTNDQGKPDIDEANAQLERKMEELRSYAYDNTPQKDLSLIRAAREANRIRVAKF